VAEQPMNSESSAPILSAPAPTPPTAIKPLTPERYKVQITVSCETHEKLRQAQDLMRHSNPTGDVATIFDRALTLLLADLLKVKCGAVKQPRSSKTACKSRTRSGPSVL
jgi:hypothetical protein